MSTSANRVMPLSEALTSILDHKGKLVEFKEDEDNKGYYVGEGSESDNNKWVYRLEPQGTPMVRVTVEKVSKESEESGTEQAGAGTQKVGTTFKEGQAEKTKKEFVQDYGTAKGK